MATISDTFTLLVETVTGPTITQGGVPARILFTLPEEADDTVKISVPNAGETSMFSAPFSYILGLPKMSGPFRLQWTKGGGIPPIPPSAYVNPASVQHTRRDSSGNVVQIDTYYVNNGTVNGTVNDNIETGSYVANLSAEQV